MTALFDSEGVQGVLLLALIAAAASLIAVAAVGLALAAYRRHDALKEEVRQIAKKARTQADAAQHDALTGLMNRRLLHRRFKAEAPLADKSGESIVVCYLDLDGFKSVNDRHGHDAGDELLIRLTRRLKRCLRSTDSIARVGGDEFVILLNGIREPEDCTRAARKMIHAVGQPLHLRASDVRVQVGASIGLSLYPKHAGELDALLRYADHALYRAKRNGKGHYVVYAPPRRPPPATAKTAVHMLLTGSHAHPARRKADRSHAEAVAHAGASHEKGGTDDSPVVRSAVG